MASADSHVPEQVGLPASHAPVGPEQITLDKLQLVLNNVTTNQTETSPPPQNVDFQFYVLSTEKSPKHATMLERFKCVGIKPNIIEEIPTDDPRISKHHINHGRCLSIMYGHLEMIKTFFDSGLEYGIMCENDLFLRKDLLKQIPQVIQDYEKHGLDIMLLSYLMVRPPHHITALGGVRVFDDTSNPPFRYCHYGDELWGAQMYLVSRDHAHRIITKFDEKYCDCKLIGGCVNLREFSSDWTITKYGDRALITPMLAVEDSRPDYFHGGQNDMHHETTKNNFDPTLFC